MTKMLEWRYNVPFYKSFFIIVSIFLISHEASAQTHNYSYKGFPENWAGDTYNNHRLPTGNIPNWLNGVLLCQLSASYGVQKPGRGLLYLADGLGAVGSFDIKNGEVRFSAAYYPSEAFQRWNYYERSWKRSGIAWRPLRSPFNVTPTEAWDRIPPSTYLKFNPNVDFWKIGSEIVAAAGDPKLGVVLNNPLDLQAGFHNFDFFDTNDVFRQKDYFLINMVAQPRIDVDGTVWSTVAALDKSTYMYYQIVFTVTANKERVVQGMYRWANFDPSKCDLEGHYFGDLDNLPGFMHFVTSTKNYLILPVSSSMLNPCRGTVNRDGDIEFIQEMGFNKNVPIRFLLFDKKNKFFLPVVEGPTGRFPSHHLNAYEQEDGKVVVDMLTYADMDLYNKYLRTNHIENNVFPSKARLSRFVLDFKNLTAKEFGLISEISEGPYEFPQINHQYDGSFYRYAYILQYPYTAGTSIVKLDLLDPSGLRNKVFDPGQRFVLSEPWFVSRPGGTLAEDDGVLLVRCVDVVNSNSYLYVLDAKTMRLLGEAALYGDVIPFGFHNRFYYRSDVMPPLFGEKESPSRLIVDHYPPLIPDRVDIQVVANQTRRPGVTTHPSKPIRNRIEYVTPPRMTPPTPSYVITSTTAPTTSTQKSTRQTLTDAELEELARLLAKIKENTTTTELPIFSPTYSPDNVENASPNPLKGNSLLKTLLKNVTKPATGIVRYSPGNRGDFSTVEVQVSAPSTNEQISTRPATKLPYQYLQRRGSRQQVIPQYSRGDNRYEQFRRQGINVKQSRIFNQRAVEYPTSNLNGTNMKISEEPSTVEQQIASILHLTGPNVTEEIQKYLANNYSHMAGTDFNSKIDHAAETKNDVIKKIFRPVNQTRAELYRLNAWKPAAEQERVYNVKIDPNLRPQFPNANSFQNLSKNSSKSIRPKPIFMHQPVTYASRVPQSNLPKFSSRKQLQVLNARQDYD